MGRQSTDKSRVQRGYNVTDTFERSLFNRPGHPGHGRAIGRTRQTVSAYIVDLRATAVFDLELKIFRLHQLGIPQDRIAQRLGVIQQRISRHLLKMPGLAKRVNTDLSKGFSIPQVAQKHGWPEPLVWSQALVNTNDFYRFKALQWGIRTWDVWNFMECDPRFGDDWPGRIAAQLVANILYFFQNPVTWCTNSGNNYCC